MNKNKILSLLVLAALSLPSTVFAIKGKTLYHYYAYESMFWPKSLQPVNAESYEKIELRHLVGRPFDTLVFSPTLGFGAVAGDLKSAPCPKYQPQAESRWMSSWRNALPDLLKSGADPIAITVKWCRTNHREAVVNLPVNYNDTHSAKPDAKNPRNSWRSYLWSDFKEKNSACLMNPDGKTSTPFASGGYVDYTSAAVRDNFAAIAVEIAGKYDLDGIMIDFTMTPSLFRSVAAGGTASPKECQLITDMMKKIKDACQAATSRLGHPVAFAARVPDSVGYCKDIGIDLQGWFDTKLLDFVVLGGFFQLNRWDVTGELAVKAGIPYYASFMNSEIIVGNDSGYYDDDERLRRNSPQLANARMLDAMLCKASGCMFTRGTHWQRAFGLNVIQPFDVKANRTADKRYFVSYTDIAHAGSTLKGGTKYATLPRLVSGSPYDLAKGAAKYTLCIWDDFDALKRDGIVPKVSLVTEVVIPSGMDTIVAFNGKEVKPYMKRAGTQWYDIPTAQIKLGANEVTVKQKGKNKRGGLAKLGNIAAEVVFPKPGK